MADQKQGIFNRGNIINAIIIIALLVVVFVPSAKALLIRGLMGVGFFRADVSEQKPVAVMSDIAFRDAAGKPFNLSGLKGKVVFLNFWATWCPPCRAEMPSINDLHQKLKADTNIVFIMADADGELDKSAAFMNKYQYSLPVHEITGNVPQTFYGGALPTTLIFDKTGALAFKHEGMANYDTGEVEEFLRKLAN
ncbi:TlpA family protein disulfide reductase [Mucilaginibacter pedocola]|uniref:Thioredoxin n=1 Tax=Mucilaginibacter pedocola TaxID=1792845 RepID=A0A1S9P6C5_9SPHI|nr:TlpA disulfide reductase family protein [Mucilaginibacter pedocola]OOQ56499.1 thioredoxin [Mucilaginibacter pedocola]